MHVVVTPPACGLLGLGSRKMRWMDPYWILKSTV